MEARFDGGLLRSPVLADLPVRHGFTTRRPDLGAHLPHPSACEGPWPVHTGWEALLDALALAPCTPVAAVFQVHGNRIVRLDAPPGFNPVADADALVTNLEDVVLTVRSADCVPILLASRRAVAAVHAGWRGTVADIAGVAVRALSEFGDGEVRAVIGPAICGSCYQVGSEVVEGVLRVLPDGTGIRNEADGPHVDLRDVNRALLERAGVEDIDVIDLCTRHHPDLLHSFRRDGAHAGRQVAAIARRSAP